jgi:hypothetical protein
MTPKNFVKYPWDSVMNKSECETIAKNIMIILAMNGNEWRDLTWDEYRQHRIMDGSFSDNERPYFEQVIGYCKSVDTAVLFSPEWAKVVK